MSNISANLALFLLDQTGSVFGKWKGHMPAKQQRALMGRFFGKGLLLIDGNIERVTMTRTVCFGTDFERVFDLTWRDLELRPDVLWS